MNHHRSQPPRSQASHGAPNVPSPRSSPIPPVASFVPAGGCQGWGRGSCTDGVGVGRGKNLSTFQFPPQAIPVVRKGCLCETPPSLPAVPRHLSPTSSGYNPPIPSFPGDRKGQWLAGLRLWNLSSDFHTLISRTFSSVAMLGGHGPRRQRSQGRMYVVQLVTSGEKDAGVQLAFSS